MKNIFSHLLACFRCRRTGMAIPVVLVFSTALLIMAGVYAKRAGQSRPVNDRLLERLQADFWGQGILQMAMLKFKQLPSEFRFAYTAIQVARLSRSPDPWGSFLGGNLQGAIARPTYPFDLTYATNFQVLGQEAFNEDSILITVEVNLAGVQRIVQHTIHARRIRN